jgi:hypothetical protein
MTNGRTKETIMSETPLGRFCWHELLTTDPEAAPGFYKQIAGWDTAAWNGAGDSPYTMWMNGESSIGGIMKLPPEAVAGGAPAHWLAHVSTPDLDATVAKVKELGGQVLTQIEVPEVGRFVVIRDPQGAVLSAYQPTEGAPGHDGPAAVGEFSWSELATQGWQGAWSFYSQVFGWQETGQHDMGDMGIYQMYGRGADPIGAMFDRPPEMPVNAWLYYIRVADVNAAAEKVKELGGQVLAGPMEVPGGDMIAHCMDPQGAAFAVHASAQA